MHNSPKLENLMANRLLLLIMMICWGQATMAQRPVFELNKKLGKGINMGNMFEAPTETEWGNPFRDDYFGRIATLGFNHVRIPIRWDTPARAQQTEPYTINKQFIERVKYVIDKALAEKLYVIINMHHHNEIFDKPDQVKPRFLSQWKQIAEYFKGYDDRLIFEVMNEPNTNLTADKWNVFFADALTEIRKTNPTRAVLMGTAPWGGLGGVPQLKIPKDDNVMITIHYYDPFTFTHQGADWVGAESKNWLGTKWENTTLERDEIVKQFQYVISFAQQNNVPINIGEFGAYSTADIDSRVKWTNFLARWFESQGFSWAYWEFSAGFGIFNPSTNQVLTVLADAMLKNPMTNPKVVNVQKIFESKFNDADTEWSLGVQPQAKATYTKTNGTATINITQASTEGWHVQFVKNDVSLKKNSRYLVSFEGSADVDVSVTNYIGKNANPYNAYSGYKAYTLTKTAQSLSYSFVMTDPDDSKARIAFDLGTKAAKISIKNFLIQEVLPDDVAKVLSAEDLQPQVDAYPNPVQNEFVLKGISKFKKVSLHNTNGQELYAEDLKGENEKKISVKDLAVGQFIILLYSDKGVMSKKMIKAN